MPTDGFVSFLTDSQPLFTRLPGFSLVYIADSNTLTAKAARLFSQSFGSGAVVPRDPESHDLLAYFRVKHGLKTRDQSVLDQRMLTTYRQHKTRFSEPRFEALFDLWIAQGDNAVLGLFDPASVAKTPGERRFSVHILNENYELLGTALAPVRKEMLEETASC